MTKVDDTRSRLVAAAEQLFAARGIDGVSLREITRASGARNAVAVQYHFADREGVLEAIHAKHRGAMEARRHAMLDQLEQQRSRDLRAHAAALVEPWALALGDPDGGLAYLQILAEVMNRPREPGPDDGERRPSPDSIQRWRASVGPLLAPDALRLHRRFAAIRLATTELGRRAASGPHTDDRLFVSQLVDLVAAVLAAPVSVETVQLADARDRHRRHRQEEAPVSLRA